MKVSAKTRLQLRVQSTLFVLLFLACIGLLAWLSTRFTFSLDLTANQRNSLSPPTQRLLATIDQPVAITAFVSPANELREVYSDLFGRYRESQPFIDYRSFNPDLVPDRLRQFNIQRDGEVVIEIDGRSENLVQVTEDSVTNTIARLLRQGERWVVFLQGHGERDPYGDANHDLQLFASRLAQKGFDIETLNLAETPEIPANINLLVIADSQARLLPGEIALINDYVRNGGNLLWLHEGSDNGLRALAEELEIEFLPGVIVDSSTQLLGLSRVDFALVADYPRHAVTTAIDSLSLFPQSRALEFHGENSDWLGETLLMTQPRSWNEVGELAGEISPGDAGERVGPLNIGYALSRSLQQDDGQLLTQRVVVVGDADFLSNQYLGNGANLALGLNMVNWLSHDDNLIAISPRAALDTRLELSQNSQLVIAVTFLLGLPVALLIAGIRIWQIRRKR